MKNVACVLAGVMMASCSGGEPSGDPASTPMAAQQCTTGADAPFGTGDAGEFCIVWQDEFEDETGFRVTLNYGNGAEMFVYETGPDSTSFFPPSADSPPGSDADLDTCVARSRRFVFVQALFPGGVIPVRGGEMEAECGGNPGAASPAP